MNAGMGGSGGNRFPNGLPWPAATSYIAMLPPAVQRAGKQLFTYTIPYGIGGLGTTLAASAVGQQASVQIMADSYFLCVALARAYLTNAGASISPNIALALVGIFDSASGSQLIGAGAQTGGAATYVENLFGTAQNPSYLPQPYVFRPSATISIAVTNLEATSRWYEFAFIGFKIFLNRAQDPFAAFSSLTGPMAVGAGGVAGQ